MKKFHAFLHQDITAHHVHHLGRGIALLAVMAFLLASNIAVSFAAEGVALDTHYHETAVRVETWIAQVQHDAYEQSVLAGYGLMGAKSEWQEFDASDSYELLTSHLYAYASTR